MTIEIILQTVRRIQFLFPTIHVGGSIGLYLNGIDLKRDLSKSDIDLTDKDNIAAGMFVQNMKQTEESSNPEDFEYQFRYQHPNDRCIKIDLSIFPEKEFDIIEKDGNLYRVSKKEDILFYKKKYAEQGSRKHQNDLKVMVIPFEEKPQPAIVYNNDDLPF